MAHRFNPNPQSVLGTRASSDLVSSNAQRCASYSIHASICLQWDVSFRRKEPRIDKRFPAVEPLYWHESERKNIFQ
jgi:hypothetical protein